MKISFAPVQSKLESMCHLLLHSVGLCTDLKFQEVPTQISGEAQTEVGGLTKVQTSIAASGISP